MVLPLRERDSTTLAKYVCFILTRLPKEKTLFCHYFNKTSFKRYISKVLQKRIVSLFLIMQCCLLKFLLRPTNGTFKFQIGEFPSYFLLLPPCPSWVWHCKTQTEEMSSASSSFLSSSFSRLESLGMKSRILCHRKTVRGIFFSLPLRNRSVPTVISREIRIFNKEQRVLKRKKNTIEWSTKIMTSQKYYPYVWEI